MKVKKKFLFLSLFFIIALMLFNGTSYAGSQSWNALDYDVTINEDGSANIVETWDVNISETNTLFKDFDLQSDKPYSFSNPRVTEIKNGKEYPLEQIFKEQYHVDPGCYYGLPIKYNTQYEIAWNVGLDNSSDTRTYKIYYTVNNAITIYNDCTEFYWQFLSDENTMTGKNVTGTIKIPNGIKDIEKLRVWAHGSLSGEIKKDNLNKITFSVPNISSNEMLELRIITENNIFPQSTNFQNINKLNDILEEEAKWAKEANLKRILYKIIIIVVVIVLIYIAILFLKKIIKYSKEGKELESKYSYPKSDLEYFRDIPNEKAATPARASYLFGYRQMNSNIFSASLLELTLRKIITLEPIDKKDANIIINNIELNIIQELPEDLKIVYELISSAASSASIGNSISISEFKKYARKNYEDYHKKFSAIEDAVDSYEHNCQNVSAEREKLKSKYSSKLALYICLIIFLAFALPFSLVYIIEILICIIICGKNVSRINILSKEGYEESNEWKGLKKYMEDFSLLNEKEVPDLILWEKYLVYATAFGISKKVLKQLEIVYPEIHNTNTYTGNYTYLNLMAHSDFDLGNSISNSLGEIYSAASNAYSSAHSSSSGGGGGGFSGGGGGRRWRPEAAVDVKNIWEKSNMKLNKKFLFLNLLFILTMMLFSGTSYAGNQSWNSLDFDVIVHEDGSMDVIETWDVNISYTNTMFKDFKLKYGEKYAFTNPKVTEVKDGVEYPLEQIYEEQYHVDPGCFYGMKVASGPYEIAWNVGLDGSSAKKIYKIYYTVTDAVKVYNDCTELYWQFLGDENTMTGKNVTGIIKIPAGITDIEKLRVWGHGNLRGDIQKIDNNTIKFTMPDVASNEMLEVRIVTDDNIYTSCTNKISKNYFDTVMEEEGKWAKEANRKRMIAKSAKYCVLAIPFLIIVIFLFSIIKLIKKGKELDEKKLTEIDLEYYREIPNEKEASPGRALYLCGFKTADSKLFSATIMDLIVKGYLTVEGTDKSDFALRLNDAPVGLLPNEELIIFNKIKDFTIDKVVKIKDLKKGLKKEPDILYYALRSVENAVDTYENTVNNYSKEKEKEQQKLRSKVSTYTGLLFVGAMLIFFAIILFNYNISLIWKLVPAIIAIEIFICLILSMRNYKKIDPLTEKGNEERAKWKGLKKYMEDFSLLNEKDIPDYVLWEKFLVYATAFGISKKVLEQLKIVCPKMLEENLNNNMYIFTNDYFLRDFNDIYHDSYVARERQQAAERRRQAVRDFWSAASSDSNWSSGSGGGGGFSGGGGGRRWRPEAAEDVN